MWFGENSNLEVNGNSVSRPGKQEPTKWYAVYTRSNFEKKVASELAHKSIDHYLPLSSEIHQWKDRKKLIESPFFPNYVFARLSDCPNERLQVVRTNGVVRILGHDGCKLEPVPDAQIETVRRMLNSEGKCYRHPILQEGQPVRVSRGPLKNIEGSLVRVKNQLRLVVSIRLLSQSVATEVDIGDVEPIAAR